MPLQPGESHGEFGPQGSHYSEFDHLLFLEWLRGRAEQLRDLPFTAGDVAEYWDADLSLPDGGRALTAQVLTILVQEGHLTQIHFINSGQMDIPHYQVVPLPPHLREQS